MLRRADPPSQIEEQPSWPQVTLRRRDQAVAALFAAVSLAAIGVWYIASGGLSGTLIDIDRAASIAMDFKLNINSADWPELALLPNVGEQLAKRIVEDRALNGPFREVSELRRVRGIGPKTLDGMRPFLLPLPATESTSAAAPSATVPDH